MEVLILVVVGAGVIGLATWLTVTGLKEDAAMREYLAEEERAFDERIRVRPLDDTQLTRLQPLIEEVSVLRVPDTERRRHERSGDDFHVFVTDSLGAVHDVITTKDRQEAVDVAVKVARRIDVELVDPERIVG